MIKKNSFFSVILLFLFISLQVYAQSPSLPRSTPEAQGVSSKKIMAFFDTIARTKNEMHGLVILRHGKVITEGWWNPYRSDLKHTMYSLSKSFTSTAIGLAVAEKKLSLDDKVISFFPDKLPDSVSEFQKILTVRDLITMSVGQGPQDPTGPVIISDDWIKTFFRIPIVNKPGTVFLYNTAATYMLSAIIQKVTGEKLVDYLTPRLFSPLGITGMDWETDPQGRNVGGWGLRIRTEDIARFGQLYLQKGKWNGKQLLPEAWVDEATSFKIDNAPGLTQQQKDSSDWRQGYCYQFWRSRHNSYRGDGAFGQYCLVLPELDAVIAITSETPDMQHELNLIWKFLLPAFYADKATLNTNDASLLKKKLAVLKLPLPPKADSVFQTPSITGKKYKLSQVIRGVESISFHLDKSVYTISINQSGTIHRIQFGNGKWIEGETTMLGPSLLELAKNHFAGLPPSQVAGSYSWKAPGVLEMHLRYIDSPHTLKMIFKFGEKEMEVEMYESQKSADKVVKLKGTETGS